MHIKLTTKNDKQLCYCREAARCFVAVISQPQQNNNSCGFVYYRYLASDLPLRNVVFGVTLRLLVIHFVVVSHHQQTRPLTSDQCYNSPWSVAAKCIAPTAGTLHSTQYQRYAGRAPPATLLITPGLLQRQQQALKPDIGSESRFQPTPPAFDATVRGVRIGISPPRLVRKNQNGVATRR